MYEVDVGKIGRGTGGGRGGAPVDAVKVLAGLADGGGVGDGCQLLDVLHEHRVVQIFVGRLQLRQQLVALQVRLAVIPQLLHHPAHHIMTS